MLKELQNEREEIDRLKSRRVTGEKRKQKKGEDVRRARRWRCPAKLDTCRITSRDAKT